VGNAQMTSASDVEDTLPDILGEFGQSADRADSSQPVMGEGDDDLVQSHLPHGAHGSHVPEHVQPMIDSLPATLTGEERQIAVDLILRNADVFSKSEYDLGRTKLVQHKIDVGENKPFKEPLRRHPRAYLEIIDKQVEEMEKNSIIERAASPWASNVVLVRKKGKLTARGGRQKLYASAMITAALIR